MNNYFTRSRQTQLQQKKSQYINMHDNFNFTPSSPIPIPGRQTQQARKQRQQRKMKANYEEIIGNQFEMKFGRLMIPKETDQNDDYGIKREKFYNSFKKQMIAIIVKEIPKELESLKEFYNQHENIVKEIEQNIYKYKYNTNYLIELKRILGQQAKKHEINNHNKILSKKINYLHQEKINLENEIKKKKTNIKIFTHGFLNKHKQQLDIFQQKIYTQQQIKKELQKIFHRHQK